MIHCGKTLGVLLCWSSHEPFPRPEHEKGLVPFAQVAAAEIAISHAYELLDEWIHSITQPCNHIRYFFDRIENISEEAWRKIFIPSAVTEARLLFSLVERSRKMREHQLIAPAREPYCLRKLVEATHASFSLHAAPKNCNSDSKNRLKRPLSGQSSATAVGVPRKWLFMPLPRESCPIDNAPRMTFSSPQSSR